MRHRASNLLRALAHVLCLPLTALAAPPACAETPTDEWHFNLGAAITRVPEYAGSAAHKTRLVPILSASHGRFFIGPVPGGGPLGNGTRMSLGRLQGDAAASPLTEQRSQNSGALFASCRF